MRVTPDRRQCARVCADPDEGAGDTLRVFDLWDSEDHFDAFSRTLRPILEDLGINSGEPDLFDVHNIMR